MVTKTWTMASNGDHGQPWLAMVTKDRPWLDMVTQKKWTMVGNGDHGQPWSAMVTKDRPWLDMVIAVFTKEDYCVHRKLKWAS
ncbi:hypothetical protein DPMN_000195 [Dreissena polymorpha]|uniref:Uncharacterized protein n=1 Tax=Dreissena polymorpha TaxID=45954 RepID=A0A9D4MHP6_DREPO|nr:hypothetical protein DPMN_000195 [Dreissena polymorpha]